MRAAAGGLGWSEDLGALTTHTLKYHCRGPAAVIAAVGGNRSSYAKPVATVCDAVVCTANKRDEFKLYTKGKYGFLSFLFFIKAVENKQAVHNCPSLPHILHKQSEAA